MPLKKKDDTKEKFDRMRILLDNLVRAVEVEDRTAMEQTCGAAREFLDQNPA